MPAEREHPITAPTDLRRLCALGERADALLRERDIAGAMKTYDEVVRGMGQQLDLYLLGRATLGLMLCYLETDDVGAAHRVWTAEPGRGGPLSAGVAALEGQQVDPRSQAIYSQVCAAIYSQTTGARRPAANGINHHMKKVLAYVRQDEPQAMPAVVGTWSLLLIGLYGRKPGWWVYRHLKAALEDVQPARVDRPVFLQPGPWRPGPVAGVIGPDGVT